MRGGVGGLAYVRSCAHIQQWNAKERERERVGGAPLFPPSSVVFGSLRWAAVQVCLRKAVTGLRCRGAVQMKQNRTHLDVLKVILFIWFGPGRSTSFHSRGETEALSGSGSFPRSVVCIPRLFLRAPNLFHQQVFFCFFLKSLQTTRMKDAIQPPVSSLLPFDLLKSTIILSPSAPPLRSAARREWR